MRLQPGKQGICPPQAQPDHAHQKRESAQYDKPEASIQPKHEIHASEGEKRGPDQPPDKQRDEDPTPNTISLTMESMVDAAAFPIACRKMNAALFTQANTTMQR